MLRVRWCSNVSTLPRARSSSSFNSRSTYRAVQPARPFCNKPDKPDPSDGHPKFIIRPGGPFPFPPGATGNIDQEALMREFEKQLPGLAGLVDPSSVKRLTREEVFGDQPLPEAMKAWIAENRNKHPGSSQNNSSSPQEDGPKVYTVESPPESPPETSSNSSTTTETTETPSPPPKKRGRPKKKSPESEGSELSPENNEKPPKTPRKSNKKKQSDALSADQSQEQADSTPKPPKKSNKKKKADPELIDDSNDQPQSSKKPTKAQQKKQQSELEKSPIKNIRNLVNIEDHQELVESSDFGSSDLDFEEVEAAIDAEEERIHSTRKVNHERKLSESAKLQQLLQQEVFRPSKGAENENAELEDDSDVISDLDIDSDGIQGKHQFDFTDIHESDWNVNELGSLLEQPLPNIRNLKVAKQHQQEKLKQEKFLHGQSTVSPKKDGPLPLIKRSGQQQQEQEAPMESEDLESWEKEEDARIARQAERAQRRSKRIPLSIGDVTLPQYLRDRVDYLVRHYYSKSFQRRQFSVRPHAVKKIREFEEAQKKASEPNQLSTDEFQPMNPHQTGHENDLNEEDFERTGGGYFAPPKTGRAQENKLEAKKALLQTLFGTRMTDCAEAKKAIEKGLPQVNYGRVETLAYVENLFTGQYAIAYRVLHELELLCPQFRPYSVLDFGSGPGTSLFAIDEVWGSNIMKTFLAVEPSSAMLDVSQILTKNDPRVIYRRFLTMGRESADYDLVTACSSLSALATPRERRDILRSLWRQVAPGGMLVVSEAGNHIGFELVREVRAAILGEGEPGVMISPCPHSLECQMSGSNWCHFKQRVNLLAHERTNINGKAHDSRDIPLSFVIFRKPDIIQQTLDQKGQTNTPKYTPTEPDNQTVASRVVRLPRKRGGHIYLDVCSPEGPIFQTMITKKSGGAFYTSARKTRWGDGFILPEDPRVLSRVETEEELKNKKQKKE